MCAQMSFVCMFDLFNDCYCALYYCNLVVYMCLLVLHGHVFFYICHCVDDLFLKHLNVLQRYDCTSYFYYVRYLFYDCRSSVTRMSSDQKQNVITKTSEEERATLDANLSHLSSSRDEEEKTPVTSPTTQDAETGTWSLHSHHTSPAAVGHSGFEFDWIVLLY